MDDSYLQAALNNHIAISVTDIEGNIISVNDKFCDLCGYSESELLGKKHQIIKSETHSQDYFQSMWDALLTGEVWQGTLCNKDKYGEFYWVNATITPCINEAGKVFQFIATATEITDLKQSEERLSKGQYVANIGLWEWNFSTNDMYWSPQLYPLLGYVESPKLASYESMMSVVHPDDRSFVEKAIQDCIGLGKDYNTEHRIILPDKNIRWLKQSGGVYRASDGRVKQLFAVVSDITSKKDTLSALQRALDEAESANRAKSRFLSNMSHELRTPMNAIMGFSQLLQMELEQPLTTKQKGNVVEIRRAGEHLLELINDLLDLSIIEGGNVQLSKSLVNVPNLMRICLKMVTPLAGARDIKLSLTDLPDESNCTIVADETRLKQVLINLLSNAIKYNRKDGEVTFSSYYTGYSKLRICVSDQGMGISNEDRSKLFKAFSRLENSSDEEGSGIGLVITQKLVEQMGGQIDFVSKPGFGSRFWVEFELQGVASRTEHNVEKMESKSECSVSLSGDTGYAPSSLLYIDNNVASVRLVRSALEHWPQVSFTDCADWFSGLKKAEALHPDVIILDVNLPDFDGFSALKALRANESTRFTPVIAIFDKGQDEELELGLKAGFNDCLFKPLILSQFFIVLNRYLISSD